MFPRLETESPPLGHRFPMKNVMPWFVSIGLILGGFYFSAHSALYLHGTETHWGYLITGLCCIFLGTGFSYMIWYRQLPYDPKHPLE